MPALAMVPSRPWRSLGGMLAFVASMECRRGHAGRGYPADRVTPGLSMLTLRVSMAPVTIAGAHFSGIEKWSRRIVLLTLLASVRKRWRFEPAAGSVPRPVAQGGEIHACQPRAGFRSVHCLSDRSQ